MAKYRKKPVIVDAVQYHKGMKHKALKPSYDYQFACGKIPAGVGIKTLEGFMAVDEGDWIIKGVKGEFYPCKPDIFEQTYEKVEE